MYRVESAGMRTVAGFEVTGGDEADDVFAGTTSGCYIGSDVLPQ